MDNATDRVYQFTAAASRTSGNQSPAASFALAAGNTNPQGIADPPASSEEGTASDVVDHASPSATRSMRVREIDMLFAQEDDQAWYRGRRAARAVEALLRR